MSQLFKNNAKSRLAAALGSGDGLTFTVTTGEGTLFPVLTVDDHMMLTLENAAGVKEIVRVSARSGDVFTINPTPGLGRGQDGTTAMGFSANDLVELRLTAGFIDALKEGSIVYVIDGGGSAITTGVKGFIEAPFNGTIKGVRLFADQPGSIVVDIWKDTYGNYPPIVGDTITAVSPPTIAADIKSQDSVLTGWTKGFSKGDIFYFNVNSCATIQRVTISMTVDRY